LHSKPYGDILTGTSLTGASNAGGVGNNRDSGRIAGYRSLTSGVPTTNATATIQFIAQTATHQLIFDDHTQISRSRHSLTLNISQTAKYTAIVAMKCE